MKNPTFSCVMAVKGARPFMKEALASLESQGMGDDLEIIIQDADVEPDRGQSDAFNKGFAKAHGDWLFWLNADDVLLPHSLERVRNVIRSSTSSESPTWITGNLIYVDAESRILKCAWERGWKFSYEGFPVRTYGPSSFFRRELFERTGGFDINCRFSMDTDMWCKFRRLGIWHYKIKSYLWGFRVHDGSLTSGDLNGKPPAGMEDEQRLLDARYGLSRTGWPLRRLKLTRLVDGSYAKSYFDTKVFRGRKWQECLK